MTFYKFTRISSNIKTGPIPATVTSSDSCPDVCPLKGAGCYAELGPVGMHWRKVDKGQHAGSLEALLDEVKRLPKGQIWRHNVAGDLPHNAQIIDAQALDKLTKANAKARAHGFTYTHHDMTQPANREAVARANSAGFTVNLSANNLEHADSLAALKVGPVVTIAPEGLPRSYKTPEGRHVITCPATYDDRVQCISCAICAKPERKSIVAFPVHGARKAKATKIFMLKVQAGGQA